MRSLSEIIWTKSYGALVKIQKLYGIIYTVLIDFLTGII